MRNQDKFQNKLEICKLGYNEIQNFQSYTVTSFKNLIVFQKKNFDIDKLIWNALERKQTLYIVRCDSQI